MPRKEPSIPAASPEKGEKADLASTVGLKSGGKMAMIMPHRVLFRGGDEKEGRKYFVGHGWLKALIGLLAGLFHGTESQCW